MSLRATIVARWADDKALLRLPDGRLVEAPVPEPLRARFDVAEEVDVYLKDGRLEGWAFSDEPLGVDFGEPDRSR